MADYAVGMVDILGYKAKKIKPEKLLSLMKTLDKTAQDMTKPKGFEGISQNANFKALFISDTFIVIHPVQEDREDIAVGYVALYLKEIYNRFLDKDMLVRGCITFGQAAVDKNFIAGKAVFEASELMEQSEEAIIWMAKSALNAIDPLLDHLERNVPQNYAPAFMPYAQITLKEGMIKTRVVSPLNWFPSKPQSVNEEVKSKILRLLSDPTPKVWVKHTATEKLLDKLTISIEDWKSRYRSFSNMPEPED